MDGTAAANTKLAKICETIREEALLPARIEAQKIEDAARAEAETIRSKAQSEAAALLESARAEIARHKQIVESSLAQASRQVVDHLKERIEQTLLLPNITEWVHAQLDKPEAVVSLAGALVDALVREGTAADLAVELPKSLSGNLLVAELANKFITQLGTNPIHFSTNGGGVVLKLQGGRMQIEVTDKVITELLTSYLRKDFRRYLFNQNGV